MHLQWAEVPCEQVGKLHALRSQCLMDIKHSSVWMLRATSTSFACANRLHLVCGMDEDTLFYNFLWALRNNDSAQSCKPTWVYVAWNKNAWTFWIILHKPERQHPCIHPSARRHVRTHACVLCLNILHKALPNWVQMGSNSLHGLSWGRLPTCLQRSCSRHARLSSRGALCKGAMSTNPVNWHGLDHVNDPCPLTWTRGRWGLWWPSRVMLWPTVTSAWLMGMQSCLPCQARTQTRN